MSLMISYLTPALAASIFTLFLKWLLDLITSKQQFKRERQKIILQRQLEVMEDAMANLLDMWEGALFSQVCDGAVLCRAITCSNRVTTKVY